MKQLEGASIKFINLGFEKKYNWQIDLLNIKYKISKESLVLQAITSFLPLGAFMFCLMNIS